MNQEKISIIKSMLIVSAAICFQAAAMKSPGISDADVSRRKRKANNAFLMDQSFKKHKTESIELSKLWENNKQPNNNQQEAKKVVDLSGIHSPYARNFRKHCSTLSKSTAQNDLNHLLLHIAEENFVGAEMAIKNNPKQFSELLYHPVTAALVQAGTQGNEMPPQQIYQLLHREKMSPTFPEENLDKAALNFARKANNKECVDFFRALPANKK